MAFSPVVSSVILQDITGFCCIDTSVADTASASRSANRRFNSLTEILARRLGGYKIWIGESKALYDFLWQCYIIYLT